MNKKLLSLLMLSTLAFAACGGGEDADVTETDSDSTEEATEKTTEEVKNPFDFPDVELSADAGDKVLTVDPKDLDEAMTNGADDSDYLYLYLSELVEVGDVESTVKVGVAEFKVHNSLIIPIEPTSAEEGDIILVGDETFYMERYLVTSGGDTVMAVSLDGFDTEYEIPAGTFNLLEDEWSPGTSIACKNDYDGYDLATVLSISDGKVLTTGWAGVITVFKEDDCIGVPLSPSIAVGDEIFIPPFATFEPGTVTAVNLDTGRVTATYDFGGELEEEEFPLGDILLEL